MEFHDGKGQLLESGAGRSLCLGKRFFIVLLTYETISHRRCQSPDEDDGSVEERTGPGKRMRGQWREGPELRGGGWVSGGKDLSLTTP